MFAKKDLPNLVLKASEAPGESVLLESETGSLTLEDVWSCCKEQLEQFRSFGFVSGYQRAFQVNNLPAEVPDWKPGIAFAKSVVLIFQDAQGASKGLPVWERFFAASAQASVDHLSPGLGDESSGVTGTFFKKGQKMYIYFWRILDVA